MWPAALSTSSASSTAALAPPMTAWLVLLMLATTTLPSTAVDRLLDLRERREHGRHQAPGRRCASLAISRPRALTASRASSKGRAPAATSAPYSPRLWPITKSGRSPCAASSRVRAWSTVEDGGLGDLGPPQVLLGLRHGGRVVRVGEHVVA